MPRPAINAPPLKELRTVENSWSVHMYKPKEISEEKLY
uniref:Uncharacterized protein n=1 Tax=Utricularia reniformis TaxID=192314 RepID=A0A1Y0B0S7_9LAMI|nr:hypothetical protein AEK19_MT0734 [Utricularia reniformis]ART30978.1 hypothetical protein AEK19_MT0734 [Utricularia reniformis]